MTTPKGVSADFDALAHGKQLFEIKTGYGFLLNKADSGKEMRENTLEGLQDQAHRQSLVAHECGYSLTWYFNNKYVADLVSGMIEPKVLYVPFSCKEESDAERQK